MKRFTLLSLCAIVLGFTAPGIAQNLQQTIDQQVNKLLDNQKISAQDTNWEITSQHTSSASGVQHAYYRQTINGIQVYGTESSVHVLPNGEVLKANTKFLNTAKVKSIPSATPTMTAVQALQAVAAQLNYTISESIFEVESIGGTSQEVVLSDGGFSRSTIPAKLLYYVNNSHELVLVWEMSIQATNNEEWWNSRVDATTGTILDKNNYMVSCAIEHDHSEDALDFNSNLYDIPNYDAEAVAEAGCSECYEIFDLPLESPYHGPRTTVNSPANLTASPFGWHDTDGAAGAEFTTTEGNNVNAYDEGMGGYQPDGGASLDFTGYDFNEVYTNANQYDDASITQLFWSNNIIHDVFYQYGYDEAAGNFQVNNYGNGGLGNDSVNAEGQSGLICNAFMGTPPDGSSPTMSMFVCNDKDGNFDSLVVFHEWAHGISNRLTGGAANTSCLGNTEQMGEGWSDWYGIILTIEPGDTGPDPRGVGSYLLGQGIGGVGVRQFHYSTDLAVNPHTYGDVGSVAIPHGVGSIWCALLWEVTWGLIDEHGYDPDIYTFTGDITQDAGNVQAMALVTEAMKLQVCSPGFIDGRDAIFAADQAIYGGANECLLWEAFAKRGLGFSADQGTSGSVTDGTEAFDSPVPAINTAEEVCVGQGVQTFGGGTPVGGVYAGPGVTDDGNGMTYTFDPAVAGIGLHTIEYDVTSACATGAATDMIEVTSDDPVLECQDVTLELDANGEAILTVADVVTNLEPGGIVVDQSGTFAPIDISGTGTSVSLTDDDVSGALPVGFSFNFYGVDYTDFYISSNGFITFDAGSGNGCCTGGTVPGADGIANLIAFAWEDIDPSSGGNIRYETVGTAPDRKLVMEFDDVPYFGGAGNVTSQVHLFEGSNRIEIHSASIPAENTGMTMGVENADETMGLAVPGRNSQTWSATDDYVAFFYAPGSPADNCGATTEVTLSQELFTCDDLGAASITVTMTDANGNSSTCTPTITVEDPLGVCVLSTDDTILDRSLSLYPNPTAGQITLRNTSNQTLTTATITDVNGRTIQTIDLSDAGTTTNLSIDQLATGMYFVKIDSESASTVKRIVKQ